MLIPQKFLPCCIFGVTDTHGQRLVFDAVFMESLMMMKCCQKKAISIVPHVDMACFYEGADGEINACIAVFSTTSMMPLFFMSAKKSAFTS